MQRLQPPAALHELGRQPFQQFRVRGRVTARAEIVHRANQSLTKVMLPDPVHDHAGDERAGTVLDIRHPFRQSAPLLRGIGPPALGAGGRPIIRGRFAPGERRQESQLHRLAPRAEIAPGQQKRFTRPGAEVSETQRGGQRFRFAGFCRLQFLLQRVPFAAFRIGKELPEILVLDLEFPGKLSLEFFGLRAVGVAFQNGLFFVADF